LTALVSDFAAWLGPRTDVPLALFGHSLGGVIAFELARTLRRIGTKVDHLIVAACPAPHCPRRLPPLHNLPDAEFIEQMRSRYGGIPREVAEASELMRLMLPTLRADVKMFETYRYHEEAPLDCPILALGGTEDKTVPVTDLAAWREHTAVSFSQRSFPGDHFFVSRSQKGVVRLIRQRIFASSS
jgi:medium-chain acyl-[acyl-carrier-protein] hydrolase